MTGAVRMSGWTLNAERERDTVAIGSSTGGVHALLEVIPKLPADLPAAVLVVQHVGSRHESQLHEIVARCSPISIVQARDGDPVEPRRVYFAPPGYHMLIEEDHIRLTTTEPVHFVRPSVDLLFASVAAARDGRAIGVILTGSGPDGASGAQAIRAAGGLTIVQDPNSAESKGMPTSAIKAGAADLILPLDEIGDAIVQLVTRGPALRPTTDDPGEDR